MKIQIENLKAQMQGRELTVRQKADALIEFNKLLDYVKELEQKVSEDYLMGVKEFGLNLEYSQQKDGRKFLEVFSERFDEDGGTKHGEWCKHKDGEFKYR